jgi:hypothetical protein
MVRNLQTFREKLACQHSGSHFLCTKGKDKSSNTSSYVPWHQYVEANGGTAACNFSPLYLSARLNPTAALTPRGKSTRYLFNGRLGENGGKYKNSLSPDGNQTPNYHLCSLQLSFHRHKLRKHRPYQEMLITFSQYNTSCISVQYFFELLRTDLAKVIDGYLYFFRFEKAPCRYVCYHAT